MYLEPWHVFYHRRGKWVACNCAQLHVQALVARPDRRCELQEVADQSQIMLNRLEDAKGGWGGGCTCQSVLELNSSQTHTARKPTPKVYWFCCRVQTMLFVDRKKCNPHRRLRAQRSPLIRHMRQHLHRGPCFWTFHAHPPQGFSPRRSSSLLS